jgi:hypothetical protein
VERDPDAIENGITPTVDIIAGHINNIRDKLMTFELSEFLKVQAPSYGRLLREYMTEILSTNPNFGILVGLSRPGVYSSTLLLKPQEEYVGCLTNNVVTEEGGHTVTLVGCTLDKSIIYIKNSWDDQRPQMVSKSDYSRGIRFNRLRDSVFIPVCELRISPVMEKSPESVNEVCLFGPVAKTGRVVAKSSAAESGGNKKRKGTRKRRRKYFRKTHR